MSRPLSREPDTAVGALCLRPSACEVAWHGQVQPLEPQVMRVLLYLVRHAGQVISRDRLIESCWDGRVVSEDAINRVMARIRRLSRDSQAFELGTVRKVGYRLMASMHEAGAEPVPPPAAESATGPEGDPRLAGSAPTSATRHGRFVVLVIGVLLAVWLAVALWPRPQSYSVAVDAVQVTEGASAGASADLTARLRHTLSRMRGVRLVRDAAAADYVLSGAQAGEGAKTTVRVGLTRRATGQTVWSARFEPAAPPAPSTTERAVAASARYLSVVLGDRALRPTGSDEPPEAEAMGLVARAGRLVAQAHDARHNRDWQRFRQLIAEINRLADEALARDPHMARALMLKYETTALPFYPYEGEDRTAYRARQGRAEAFMAQAVAMDPNDAVVLTGAGRDLMMRQRWVESERLLLRAVAIDPNSFEANTWYAYFLGLTNRCEEGLRHARLAAALAPDDVWRQMAVPRLVHCGGAHEKAARLYEALIDRHPGNVFVLRDLYLMRLAQGRAPELRRITRHVAHDLWQGRPPPDIAAMLDRMARAADAIEGRPAAFVALLDLDRAALQTPDEMYQGFGKSRADAAFVIAAEYGFAGQDDRAVQVLTWAVDQGALYLPWMLPSGASPLPERITRRADYQALWRSSPELVDLMRRRKRGGLRMPWEGEFHRL